MNEAIKMQRYLIKEAKVDEGRQMLTCNPPIEHPNVASVRYESDVRTGWLHCVNVLGYHEFYHSDEDIHSKLVWMADENKECIASKSIEEFDGVDLLIAAADEVDVEEALGYTNSYEEWARNHNEFMSSYPAFPLVRYAIALSEMWKPDDISDGVAEGSGRYADDIDFDGFLRKFDRTTESD